VVKKTVTQFILLVFVCLIGILARGADQPLSVDDIRLLLIGGGAPAKIVSLIEQRGISFHLTSELEKKLKNDGADNSVIGALQKAENKPAPNPANERPAPASKEQPSASASSSSSSADRQVAETLASLDDHPAPDDHPAQSSPELKRSKSAQKTSAAPAPAASPLDTEVARGRAVSPEAKPARANLSDPTPDQTQKIIQEFAAKEKLFKEARNNYTYHQTNKVEEFGADGDIDGVYEQEWDILYDDNGQRIERVTYAPTETLKRLILTKEDLYAFRNTNPFVLTSDELSEYEVKYLGHVKVDEITAYVFSIRPRELQKGRQYFQGVIWVDDRDLQIVKSEGKPVPEPKTKGVENLFPRFTTYREQIDGKYWFPTFTTAEDTLYFSTGSVHMKEIIRYSEYKQFKSKTRILSATPTDQPNAKPIQEPPQPKQ
jgi:hypothetical protein